MKTTKTSVTIGELTKAQKISSDFHFNLPTLSFLDGGKNSAYDAINQIFRRPGSQAGGRNCFHFQFFQRTGSLHNRSVLLSFVRMYIYIILFLLTYNFLFLFQTIFFIVCKEVALISPIRP